MKNSAKNLFMALAVIAAGGAFAAANDTVITFSAGPAKYADGTQVKEGEWYALCSTTDGAFDGITADGKAVNSEEKVLAILKLADKNGACPTTILQIDSALVTANTSFSLLLLDTRGVDGKVAAATPTAINSTQAILADVTAGTATGDTTAAISETALPADFADYGNPSIDSFEVVDGTAYFKVSKLHPALRYTIKKGATVQDVSKSGVDFDAKTAAGVIPVAADDANFFQVVRKPIK